MNRSIVAILLVACLIASCKCDLPQYTSELPAAGWSQESPIVFDGVQITDDCSPAIIVAHSREYGWENLYVRIVQLNGTDTLSNLVVSVPLMDKGAWLGEKCCEDLKVQHAISLQPNTGDVHIYQNSRTETLTGISRVSLADCTK